MNVDIESLSAKDTEKLGFKVGQSLQGGECIELRSDLGGGKTTFVRGIVSGLGSKSSVSSPTFTISQVYQAENFNIQHFDFYRLTEPGLIKEELSESVKSDDITIVEWGESVYGVLPEERIIVTIEKKPTDENARLFKLKIPSKYKYVLEKI